MLGQCEGPSFICTGAWFQDHKNHKRVMAQRVLTCGRSDAHMSPGCSCSVRPQCLSPAGWGDPSGDRCCGQKRRDKQRELGFANDENATKAPSGDRTSGPGMRNVIMQISSGRGCYPNLGTSSRELTSWTRTAQDKSVPRLLRTSRTKASVTAGRRDWQRDVEGGEVRVKHNATSRQTALSWTSLNQNGFRWAI